MNKFKKKTRLSVDERIENSKFDFCKNMKWFLIAPILIIVVGVVMLCTLGFNLGIDFTGGSNMTIYTNSEGTYEEYTSYDLDTDMGKLESKINEVLKEYGLSINTIQKTTISNTDLGLNEESAVIIKYQNDNSKEESEIEQINDDIQLALLKAFGYVDSDTTFEELENLDQAGFVTNGGVTTASASAELVMKSFIALIVAVVLILIYVAFRFEFTSGMAAILGLMHDILITSSVMLICRIQINVSFIAALITILGYSVNNAIIIFDRMRDDLKVARQSNQKVSNKQVANNAVKNMLMRSVLTTFTTFIMVFMITVIGVTDIRTFTFPIIVGILSGFYSSIFIIPGLWAIAYRPRKRKKISNNNTSSQKKDDTVEVVG